MGHNWSKALFDSPELGWTEVLLGSGVFLLASVGGLVLVPLKPWFKATRKGTFKNLSELKQAFRSVDYVVRPARPNPWRIHPRKLEEMKSRTITRTLKNPENYAPFLAIRNACEYDAAVIRLSGLVDEIGDNPRDPRHRFIDTLSVLIEAYDEEHHEVPDLSGAEMLKFLMEQVCPTQFGEQPSNQIRVSSRCRLCGVPSDL